MRVGFSRCLDTAFGHLPRAKPMQNALHGAEAIAGRHVARMGLGRVELPTSRLSGVRSNHLSYRPGRETRKLPRRGGRVNDRAGGREARRNANARVERAMHGTALGDLGEANALIVRERPGELECALDVIEPHRPILALLLVGGVRSTVMQPHDDPFERPLFSVGVHPERDGGARA